MSGYHTNDQINAAAPAGAAAQAAMQCIPWVARDMYAGLKLWVPQLSEEAFMQAVILYHEVKHGLSDRTMDSPPVDEHTFFVLKKCIFHWVKGIELALLCLGWDPEEALRFTVTGCAEYLHRPVTAPRGIQLHYDRVLSPAIRQQYAKAGQIPSNEWCAWLELEAARVFACARQLQIKGA